MTPTPRPFTVQIPDAALKDLRARVRATRWPAPTPDDGWAVGTDTDVLRRLLDRWGDGYDWRAREAALNELPHFVVDLDGAPVHFLHFRAEEDGALPLLLSHGWPGSFLELTALAERLASPSRHGEAGRASFDVVVPSLPGFGFSAQRPELTDDWSTPELWHRLMTGVLGYARYGAHGGDLGAGITARLARRHGDALAGIHLLAVGEPPDTANPPLSDEEAAFLEQRASWSSSEGAYLHQQQTKPLTLAYGLADSPAGWLAWVVEKLRGWSDCGGDVFTRFDEDEILTWASLYWLTNTIASSFRPYHDHLARPAAPGTTGDVPTAVAVFPHDLVLPPRAWAERIHHVVRYRRFPRGGHFAAYEEPALLAEDVAEFFSALR